MPAAREADQSPEALEAPEAPEALRPAATDSTAGEPEQLRVALAAAERERGELLVENAQLRRDREATASVLHAIVSPSATLQHVLDTVARLAAQLCDAEDAVIGRVAGDTAGPVAHYGTHPYPPTHDLAWDRPLVRNASRSIAGRAIRRRRTVHIADLAAVPEHELPATGARRLGVRAFAATPMFVDSRSIGYITLERFEPRPFTAEQLRLLETFAAQAAIAIENARLLTELQASNRTLQEALEHQTATSEILRVIAASPTGLDGVLATIAASAARLLRVDRSMTIWLRRGDRQFLAAHITAPRHVPTAEQRALTAQWRREGRTLDRGAISGRAILDGVTVHVPDVQAPEAQAFAPSVASLQRYGWRRTLAVPLLGEGAALGCLQVVGDEPGAYPPEQIALLEAFAAQAVIAIENARLFGELQERDERRRRELERAAAIQQRLLPMEVRGWPGVLEIAHRFRPAVETSGDFYDVLRLAPSTEGALPPLQIAVGDVAGKGMAAALVTALARSALRSSLGVPIGMATPAGTLRTAGQRLHQDVGGQLFVACALAVVEPPGRHHAGPLLRLANAAQVPVLLVRGGEAQEIEPPGYRLPLGAQDDGAYDDVKVALRPGDVVVFSSDGLVEAPARAGVTPGDYLTPPAAAGELFGFARLAAAARRGSRADSAEGVAEGVWQDLAEWCGEESHHDDMTLLVLRVPDGPA